MAEQYKFQSGLSIEALSRARASGYSDDEIAGILADSDPKIRSALEQGYSSTDILQVLSVQKDKAATRQAVVDDTTNPGDVLTGRVTTRMGQGAKQIGMEAMEGLGLIPEGIADQYGQQIAQEERLVAPLRSEYPAADVTSQITGEGPAFAIGGGQTLAKRFLTGPAVDLGLAGLQPGTPEERLQRMTYAAPISLGGFGIMEGIGAVNRAVSQAPSWREELITFGEKEGIPIYYPDVAGGTSRMMSERVLADVPIVGTGRRYRAQRDNIARRYNELPSRVARGGADVSDEAIQSSMRRRYNMVRDRAKELYDNVERLAGDAPVDTTRFKRSVQNAIDTERARGRSADQGLIDLYEEWLETPVSNFKSARELRSTVRASGRDFEGMMPTTATASRTKQRAAQSFPEIQDALETDMRAFTQAQGGELARLDKQADTFYRTNKAERYTGRRGVRPTVGMKPIRSNLPEDAWAGFRRAKTPKAAREYVAALDLQGKESARRRLMKEILEESSGVTDEGVEYISPAMYRRVSARYERQLDALFPGQARDILRGYEQLGAIMRNVSKHGAMPLTGYDLRKLGSLLGVPAAVAVLGAKTAGAPGVLLGGIGVSGLSQLLTTEGGRDFLIALSKLRSGELARIARQLGTASTRAGALEAAEYGSPDMSRFAPTEEEMQTGVLDQ